jgi:hypothetical protein
MLLYYVHYQRIIINYLSMVLSFGLYKISEEDSTDGKNIMT